jgi:putative flippase GtrA
LSGFSIYDSLDAKLLQGVRMIALKYGLFAVIAIAVNLGCQYAFLALSGGRGTFYLTIAMAFGTLAGLFCKFVLDKKFVFYYESQGKKDEAKKFALYSFMGIFTTIIFWGTELGFDYFFGTENAKYAGGLLGLVVGYLVKYYLDKRWVFGGSKENSCCQNFQGL